MIASAGRGYVDRTCRDEIFSLIRRGIVGVGFVVKRRKRIWRTRTLRHGKISLRLSTPFASGMQSASHEYLILFFVVLSTLVS